MSTTTTTESGPILDREALDRAIQILLIAKEKCERKELVSAIRYLKSLRCCVACGQPALIADYFPTECSTCSSCFNCCECSHCKGCKEYVQEDLCGNCERCSDCCDCFYCEGCLETLTVTDYCEDCERCESCCNCWTCPGCDRRYSENENQCGNCECCERCCECFYCDRGGESVTSICERCENCERHCDCADSSVVKSYDTDVLDYCEFFGTPKDKTWYGVELEVNVRQSRDYNEVAEDTTDKFNSFVILKQDGSIGERGFEIVTAPADLDSHREQWKRFFSANPSNDLSAWESGRCGMHVHISRPSALTVGKMLVLLNSDYNSHLVNTVAGRSQSNWAKIYPKKITDWDKSQERYEALNVQNRDTVELRIFRSTLKETSFWKNLEFAHAVLNFCRQAGISQLTTPEFLKFIQRVENRKSYAHLIAFLKAKEILPCA